MGLPRNSHILKLFSQAALTCLLLLAPLHSHSLTCAQTHRSAKAFSADSITIAKQLADIIRAGYPGPEWTTKHGIVTNPEFPTSSLMPHVAKVLEQVPKLKEAQKQQLINLVRATPALEKGEVQLRQLILLGLHDRSMWISFVSKFNLDPLGAHYFSTFISSFAQNMPESLKQEVLAQIGRTYFQLSKEAPFREQAAKRTADYFFKVLLRGDQLIESEIAKGQTARQAFETYLRKVESLIPNNDPFTSEQMFGMFRLAQKSLQEQSASLPNQDGEAPVLHIYGSVPNGRAKKMTSDLDAVLVHAKPNEDLYLQIDTTLRKFVQNLAPGSEFSFGMTLNSPDYGGAKHPVIIRVTIDKIEMLIFSPDTPNTFKTYLLE